ncbi:hypothetical protein IJD34_03355 [bacterium]|nr:hypothetical protein [bacterium]
MTDTRENKLGYYQKSNDIILELNVRTSNEFTDNQTRYGIDLGKEINTGYGLNIDGNINFNIGNTNVTSNVDNGIQRTLGCKVDLGTEVALNKNLALGIKAQGDFYKYNQLSEKDADIEFVNRHNRLFTSSCFSVGGRIEALSDSGKTSAGLETGYSWFTGFGPNPTKKASPYVKVDAKHNITNNLYFKAGYSKHLNQTKGCANIGVGVAF